MNYDHSLFRDNLIHSVFTSSDVIRLSPIMVLTSGLHEFLRNNSESGT